MPKIKALGTTITFNALAIGGLTSIGDLAPTADEIDVTTLDSPDGYKEFLQGLKDSGELPIAGHHIAADVGQVGIRAGFASGDVDAVVITFPDNSTASFNAWVKSHRIGGAEVAGAVGFGATLRITGAIVIA